MDQVADLLKRPKCYYSIDGVGELGMGFMMLGFGLIMWVQAHAPKGSAWHGYAAFIYMAAVCSILHYGTKALKTRYTYPRTGFVEYRKRDRVWSAIAAALVAPLVAVGIAVVHRRHWNMPPFGSLFGLFMAAGYGYQIALAVPWKLVTAVAMAVGSLALAFPPASLSGVMADNGTYLLSCLLCGVLFSISGGISFWLYLKRTREEQ